MSDEITKKLAKAGVFKGFEGLEGLANAKEFWEQQMYGTRLYYGPGIADYLHHGVLETAIKLLATPDPLEELPARVLAMCKARGWSMHWTHRGAYLHLEASELIEAIRGKHGDPADEAGDVLLVLMSITEYAGIPFAEVIARATAKLAQLETAPRYPGEEYSEPRA